MGKRFTTYIPKGISKLEPWRDEITEMREAQWPYHAIADWLACEQALTIRPESIGKYCRSRGISKNGSVLMNSDRQNEPAQRSRGHPLRNRSRTPLPEEQIVFEYEDSGPIEIYK